ncbi:MAG TPA: MFS transporter, partial [Thermomicrobiales bacterium]|nr:MFS transporter [Thermomicrobiales bacterium]
MSTIRTRIDRVRRPAGNPVPIYLLIEGGQAFLFALTFTLNLIYQVTVAGLSPLEMVLVGTILEATCFLFEVPTGIVADLYSRRRSILIGIAVIGIGFILEGSIPAFVAIALAQVIWGIGYTFTSGAVEAWITDEIGEDAVGPVFLRGSQVALIGGIAGTLLGTGLGLVALQLPIVLGGLGMIALALMLFVVMPERHMTVTPAEDRGTFGHMKHTFVEGVRLARRRPVVRTLIAISLVVGLASEAFDRLNQVSILDRFTDDFPHLFGSDSPALVFGLSSLVGTVLGLLATELLRRHRPESLGAGTPARLLAGLAAVQVGATIGFVLMGNLWLAFGMLWLRGVAGTLTGPVSAAWMNRHLDSSLRATVISMEGQANAIGQVVGGPPLGWVGSRFSVATAIV